ncbi:hypothetical protein Pcinc_017553 [Petrolisthes cinctipes]|uniref:Uncharacterized protein n=1 Tax=Petrolisthes cinctipes TaxID=88211 RepID=A0AAE1FQI0_PETCI|nr:hypothetical protein Pcinc_017553 [Petrolisthes cinctipes]
MDEIAGRLNLTYTVQSEPPDGQWAELVNGSWTGMAGQLVRMEKDTVINTFALLYDRLSVMDFSVTFSTDSYSAVLRLPPPPPRWLAVFYPFSGASWAALGGTLLLLAVFSHLLLIKHNSPVYNHKLDVFSTAIWVGRVLVKQSVPLVPSAPGIRPFLMSWWLMALVLATSYVTNIIAYITVPDQPRKIRTLEELASSRHPLQMSDYGSFIPGYMATSNDPVYQRLANKLSFLSEYDEIMVEVIHNQAAIIEGTAYMDFVIRDWPVKDLYYVEEKLYPYYMSWAFQKGTSWIFVFNRYLRQMTESGLVERWRKEVVARLDKSKKSSQNSSSQHRLKPLTLVDLQTSFYILGLGMLAGLLMILIEIFTNVQHNDQ